MTRTERASSPKAQQHDRSENKGGIDSSIRKGGAGAHNWGSIDDEARYEQEGLEDERLDIQAAAAEGDEISPNVAAGIEDQGTASRSVYTRTVDEGERQKALDTRQSALKKDVDLGEIARTSAAVSGSPPVNYNVNQ
ncbi:hypothetical protein PENSPDRAFT_46398 [Peniophora sp. CONT]|nr:hypothetical protein PENSPDRAFT_46398 [Peniophora sp. CONT]